MEIFWELYQYNRIAEAAAKAAHAERKVSQVAGRVDNKVFQLERQIERLSLGCQAMWEIVTEVLGVEEETILKKMEEIDLRDGKLDGKIGRQQIECDQCGRLGNSARRKCLYCGTDSNRDHLFG